MRPSANTGRILLSASDARALLSAMPESYGRRGDYELRSDYLGGKWASSEAIRRALTTNGIECAACGNGDSPSYERRREAADASPYRFGSDAFAWLFQGGGGEVSNYYCYPICKRCLRAYRRDPEIFVSRHIERVANQIDCQRRRRTCVCGFVGKSPSTLSIHIHSIRGGVHRPVMEAA